MKTTELIKKKISLGRKLQTSDVVLSKGSAYGCGCGRHRYMDCLSAYSAVNQGHCHPKIYQALVDQAQKLTLTSRAFRNDQLPLLYEELCNLTDSHKMLPMNSGAEAVETVIKCARKWGYESKGVARGRADIIVCSDNFHGRTLSIIGFSTDDNARQNFGPFTPGFTVIPFGMPMPWKPPLRRIPWRSWWSPSKGKPGSSFRPKDI